jgi:site-specific DNA-methyltransferase (adenine-specific)
MEASRSSRFLGKPNQPNGIIKNDSERILMLRKPGYRSPSWHQVERSQISDEDYAAWFRGRWTDIQGARATVHPAPFPAVLAERIVRMFSFDGDVVMDPFLGTGTTMLAAMRAGRHSIGYDVVPEYCDRSVARLCAAAPGQIAEVWYADVALARPIRHAA